MHKVYLSSTFRDLEEYRGGLIELFTLLNNAFPLNAMEMYTAVDTPTLQNCIDDAAACDIYILLLANRYGYIPTDAALNPDNKSITEREFETAIQKKKVVFAFFADTALKDKFPGDDDEQKEEKQKKLATFRQRVTELKQPSSPFSSPKGLSDRVSSALIKWLNTQLPAAERIFDEKVKYCCDRSPQFTDYERFRSETPSKFHAFISNGIPEDLGGNLVNRCAIFSLSLDETDIFTIAFDEFFDEDYATSRSKFMYQLRKKISTIDESFDIPTSKVFEEINQKAKDHTVIKLTCHEDFLAEEKILFLATIFGEFYTACGQPGFGKYIYFFLNVEDGFDKRAEKELTGINLLKQQIQHPQPHVTFLPRFKTVDLEILKIWLQNYITTDEGQKEDLLDAHFSDLKPPFRMRQAEKHIRTFYKRIADKDPVIINILKH